MNFIIYQCCYNQVSLAQLSFSICLVNRHFAIGRDNEDNLNTCRETKSY